MTNPAPDYAALLGSRICHDLISPLGAIGNGVELLQMSGVGNSPEMALISESVENANARVRFFRVAFGAAQPGQSIAAAECRSVLGPVGRARNLVIDWQIPGPVPRDEARLAFLLLQCCESAMPWGGQVAVTIEEGAWRISGQAKRIKHDDPLWGGLQNEDGYSDPAASDVHFPFARMAAEQVGRTIRASLGETSVEIVF